MKLKFCNFSELIVLTKNDSLELNEYLNFYVRFYSHLIYFNLLILDIKTSDIDSMVKSHQNLAPSKINHVEPLTPNVKYLEVGPLGGYVGSWGPRTCDGINGLTEIGRKQAPSPQAPRKATWGHNQPEDPHWEPGHAGTLIRISSFQKWEVSVYHLSHPGILFYQPELNKTASSVEDCKL